jgi:hypothetical protein
VKADDLVTNDGQVLPKSGGAGVRFADLIRAASTPQRSGDSGDVGRNRAADIYRRTMECDDARIVPSSC